MRILELVVSLSAKVLLNIVAAKKADKYVRRKTVITKKLIARVQDLKETKNLSITQIAKITGIIINTIYKILKEKLNYIPYN
jgi:DNA invertase Pin-like site-specific DNA recombinase